MNIDQVRDELHRLIDEVDDIYVLNGMYRTLMADKRQREDYEAARKQPDAPERSGTRTKRPGGRG
jgi:hypothetical protein